MHFFINKYCTSKLFVRVSWWKVRHLCKLLPSHEEEHFQWTITSGSVTTFLLKFTFLHHVHNTGRAVVCYFSTSYAIIPTVLTNTHTEVCYLQFAMKIHDEVQKVEYISDKLLPPTFKVCTIYNSWTMTSEGINALSTIRGTVCNEAVQMNELAVFTITTCWGQNPGLLWYDSPLMVTSETGPVLYTHATPKIMRPNVA